MTKQVTVLTTGIFDVLSPEHIEFLEACRVFGSKLIVGVADDVLAVSTLKYLPVFDEQERAYMVNALEAVNQTIIFGDRLSLLHQVKPDVYVHPEKAVYRFLPERQACKQLNISFMEVDYDRFKFLDGPQIIRSIIEDHLAAQKVAKPVLATEEYRS